ncbi:MAG: hypothetical protein ACRBBV_12195 [Paracoccaceae bacterium]
MSDLITTGAFRDFMLRQNPEYAAYRPDRPDQDMAGWPFFQTTSDGVRCIRACDVGELLLKPGAVINTLHLGAICAASEHVYDMHPSNFGAWKGWRFCFRLVYDLPDNGASRS